MISKFFIDLTPLLDVINVHHFLNRQTRIPFASSAIVFYNPCACSHFCINLLLEELMRFLSLLQVTIENFYKDIRTTWLSPHVLGGKHTIFRKFEKRFPTSKRRCN
jgi:site-specific DNA-adenine methylase